MLGFRFDRMRNHENQKCANHKMPVYSVYLKNKVYMTALREKIRSRFADLIRFLTFPRQLAFGILAWQGGNLRGGARSNYCDVTRPAIV